MDNGEASRSWWRFFDGSVSISVSMLIAVALRKCGSCADLPLLGYIRELTELEDGVIIVATLLLFPTTAALYGGFKMFFAAKEAVERKARERGRQEGRQEGRLEERNRISKVLEQHGVSLPPELVRSLTGESE